MTKEKLLQYLRDRQDVLKISAIGRRAGVPNLNHIVSGRVNSKGYIDTLADKHIPALLKEVERLRV